MIRFSIRNPLIVNFILLIIIVLGILSWNNMPKEIFPTIERSVVEIKTRYEGAPPVEVERQITIPIEEEIDELNDIDYISSESREGYSVIRVQLRAQADVDEFVQDARASIDAITDLPAEAERTQVRQLRSRFPVISVSVYGQAGAGELIHAGRLVKRSLQKIKGVGSVNVSGEREWEVWVIFDPHVAAAKKVSFAELRDALRSNLRDQPGGSLLGSEGDIQLRGLGTAMDIAGIKNIPIRTDDRGGQLNVGDVAEIDFRLETAQTLGRYNSWPSLNLVVTKTADSSTIEVSRHIKQSLQELRQRMPPGVQLGHHSDSSVFVQTRLDTVFSSGLIGLFLLLLSLYILLDLRVALIAALGIPVSFLVAVVFINYLGFTINMVSLFAFLIALGMIVDDAIIVTENIYRHLEEGMPYMQAAITGAREVAAPVIAATLTTVAAFLPMFAISGTLGAFITVIPIVVSAALLGSLFEAFMILPSHANYLFRHYVAKPSRSSPRWSVLLAGYECCLRWVLRQYKLISLVAVCVLVVVTTLALTRTPFQLFGHVDIDQFFVNVEMPNTYSMDNSMAMAAVIEEEVRSVFADHDGELQVMLSNVGVILVDYNRSKIASNYIQLLITLEAAKPTNFIERYITPLMRFRLHAEGSRQRDTETIIQLIRQRLMAMADVKRLSIVRPEAGPAGSDVVVAIAGEDVDVLRRYGQEVIDFLNGIEGVSDERHDVEYGKLEFRYRLSEQGKEIGMSQKTIADIIRAGYLGLEVSHVNWGKERYPVRVIFPEEIRQDSSYLSELPLILPDGRTVHLREVADIELDRATGLINRLDGRRIVTISSEVDAAIITALEVYAMLDAHFAPLYQQRPGYELSYRGEKRAAAESLAGVKNALFIALLLVLFILTVLFRSLLDPLVVMVAIPFGFVGVALGHFMFSYNLQFVSMVGLVALSGIIVNDSLILIDFVKKQREHGKGRIEAIVLAGRRRARPILLTTTTTFLGIAPLIFFATGQTAFLSPMAVSLGFGLIFATVLILLVLPCFYLLADDMRNSLRFNKSLAATD